MRHLRSNKKQQGGRPAVCRAAAPFCSQGLLEGQPLRAVRQENATAVSEAAAAQQCLHGPVASMGIDAEIAEARHAPIQAKCAGARARPGRADAVYRAVGCVVQPGAVADRPIGGVLPLDQRKNGGDLLSVQAEMALA